MSRDIFVQDIPDFVTSVDEVPDDWMPQPLRFGHAEVLEAVRHLAPAADVSDPTWVRVSLPGVDIEVDVSMDVPLNSFALHVRASDVDAANDFISSLLTRLGVRAFDPESDSGIFAR